MALFWKLYAGFLAAIAIALGAVAAAGALAGEGAPDPVLLLQAAVLAGVLAAVPALILARQVRGALLQLHRSVETMLAGDIPAVPVAGKDELASLAAAFNTMAARLAERLETITIDRNKLRAVLAGMVEGVVAVDADGRIVHCNDAGAKMLGLAGDDPHGGPAAEVLRWPRLVAALDDCLRGGESTRFELTLPEGASESLIEVQATPLRDGQGRPAGAALVLHDVSRLRQLERMRRDFVANVSHELKTPLAAIKGLCETLLEDAGTPEPTRQRFLGKIAKQTERLAKLVSDLLTLSRLDEGSGYLTGVEPCDWAMVIKESMRDLLPLAQTKGLEVQVDLPRDPVVIAGEPEALRQVVDNLVDNAIKYTPAGGNVRISLRCQEREAVFEVEDTGIGLSPEHQERVFERFYRVDRARSRELGGTGLGLAIVKNIAWNLAGRVSVASEPGKGSTFRVVLPLASETTPSSQRD